MDSKGSPHTKESAPAVAEGQSSPKVTCASGPMPPVSGGCSSPDNHLTGGSVPGVSGDSSGRTAKDSSAPGLRECRDSPNPSQADTPQQPATGALRTPITG